VNRVRSLAFAFIVLGGLAAACAPLAPRDDAHVAVVSAHRRTFRVPAPAGMVSDLGRDPGADVAFRVAVPSDLEMLAHFSPGDTSQRDWHASFEMARSLPEDDASSLSLFAEMRKFVPLRYERARAAARPEIRALALSLREGVSDPAAADVTVLPREQVPIAVTRDDARAIIGFALIGMPESADGRTGPHAALVGTAVVLLKNRVTYLYYVGRLPAQGAPLDEVRPALETWTEKVLAANR
jgi:hypothetical protein